MVPRHHQRAEPSRARRTRHHRQHRVQRVRHQRAPRMTTMSLPSERRPSSVGYRRRHLARTATNPGHPAEEHRRWHRACPSRCGATYWLLGRPRTAYGSGNRPAAASQSCPGDLRLGQPGPCPSRRCISRRCISRQCISRPCSSRQCISRQCPYDARRGGRCLHRVRRGGAALHLGRVREPDHRISDPPAPVGHRAVPGRRRAVGIRVPVVPTRPTRRP